MQIVAETSRRSALGWGTNSTGTRYLGAALKLINLLGRSCIKNSELRTGYLLRDLCWYLGER